MISVRAAVLSVLALNIAGSVVSSAEICEDQVLQGFTEPAAIVEVASREPGLLARMHVKPGARIEAGELLAELDKTLAEADVAAARSRASATGRIDAAEARSALARERLSEMQKLRRSGAARPLELIAAEADAAISAAEVRVARDEIAGSTADLARAEARLALLDIVAPISGIVREIHRRVGEFVGAGGDPRVLTLLDDRQLEIDFFAPYSCLTDLPAGMAVEVDVDRALRKAGRVVELGADVDAATGLRRIRIAVDNSDAALLSGQRAELRLPLGRSEP